MFGKDDFMKNKVFERALSVVVALAVIMVSMFTVISGVNIGTSAATVEDTWDGTKVKPTKTDADGNILIETAEELAWIALEGSTEETKDKNYKVIDGAVFNLNGKTGITLDSTASDVSDATLTGKNWVSSARNFAGNFDGNGVVIYNMYCGGSGSGAYGGLFPWLCVDNTTNTCNFSNITIKASYAKGYHYAAALIGFADSSGANRNINITNVKVEACYINALDNNSVCGRTAALLVGFEQHCKVTVDGCIAIDNVVTATDIKGGFVGNSSAYAKNNVFKNSVVIGSTAYPVVQSGSSKVIQDFVKAPSNYSNVYTDQDVASNYAGYNIKVASADMKGAAAKVNMSGLDWSKLIAFDGEYPDLRVTHALNTVSNGASGHSTTCSDCGKALTETHNMIDNFDTLISSCSCGYEKPITQMKDTWDGSLATNFKSGTGTKDDPYIIGNAEQMAYVALSTTLDSKGKYFKVVDNAVFDMNGAIGITLDSTAADVKAALKNGAYDWSSDKAVFNGNFDGNGAIIYNIYSKQSGYAGLFPNINTNNDETSVTIKNVAVKASFFAGYHAAGGIVGQALAGGTTQSLSFENCKVENCYMTDMGDTNTACSRTTGTIAATVAHNEVTVDNCLAKGNVLESINIVGGFVGNTSHYAPSAIIKNSVSIGTLPYPTQNKNSSVTLEDQISTASCYSNVYTDQNVSSSYSAKQVARLTTEQMSGAKCLENLTLDFENVWFANDGTVELKAFHNLVASVNAVDAYSGHDVVCDTCGIKGVETAHIYDDAFTCTLCSFTCDHKNDKYITEGQAPEYDCTVDAYITKMCECGYSWNVVTGPAPGHILTKVDAKAETCAKDGNIEHWICSTCDKIFLTDDKMAPTNTAVSIDDVTIKATGLHVEMKDSNGELIYLMDETTHSTYCEVCLTKIETKYHKEEYVVDEHGHMSHCSVCLYATKSKEAHTFETDESGEGVYHWCEDEEGYSCGYEIFNYSLESDDGLLTVTGTENVFTKDVITDIFKVSEEETLNYAEIKEIFDNAGQKNFNAYEFSPTQEVANGGSIELKMVVNDIYGSNAAIYYVDVENKTLKKLDTSLAEVKDKDADEKADPVLWASTTITEDGIYAVALDEQIGAGSTGGNNNDAGGNNVGINGDNSPTSPNTSTQNVASAAVVAVLSAAAIVFARKIKNY